MCINWTKVQQAADKHRAKAAASKPGKVLVSGVQYDLVYNVARGGYDLMLGGELEVQLTAYQMAKAKRDAIEWLSN